jgi:hypothetical protein
VDLLVPLALGALLAILFVWTSRRYGPPRLYVGRVTALWLLAGILTVIVIALELR